MQATRTRRDGLRAAHWTSIGLVASLFGSGALLSRAEAMPEQETAAPSGTEANAAIDAGAAGDAGGVTDAGAAGDAEPAALSAEERAAIEGAVAADQRALAKQQGGAVGSPGAAASGGGEPARAGAAAASPSAVLAYLPDIALVLGVSAAYLSAREPIEGGEHDPHETGFNLQGLELSLGKAADPYFRFDGNLLFGLEGVDLEEAYATTLSMPFRLQARAGKLLTRFGRINAMHPHRWHFVDQALMVGRIFGGEGNTSLGAELSWLTPLPWYVEIVVSSTDARGGETARTFLGEEDRALRSPLDLQNMAAVKQFFDLSDDWSLLFGLSAANGPNAFGPDRRSDLFGADLYLKYRPISRASTMSLALQAEWFYRRRQTDEGFLQDTGGYAQLVYQLGRFQAGGRYEYLSPAADGDFHLVPDPLDPDAADDRHRGAALLGFLPTEYTRLRLQGSADAADFRPEIDWAAILALEVSVGAHAAHAF